MFINLQLGLSLSLTLEMAYFNESKSAWEPVVEPVEQKNDKLLPYEIFIEVYIVSGVLLFYGIELYFWVNSHSFKFR